MIILMSRLQEILLAALIAAIILVGYAVALTGRYQPITVRAQGIYFTCVLDTWTGEVRSADWPETEGP
jgi:hypothetical protein